MTSHSRAIPGDPYDEEIRQLFREHEAVLTQYLRWRGAGVELAEEIALDAFMAVRRQMEKTTIENLRAYLYTVARNEFVKRAMAEDRRTSPLDPLPEGGAIDDRGQHDPAGRASTLIDLTEAMAKLRPRERDVLTLRFICGLDVSETAEFLGIRKQSVNNTTTRARQHLQELLGEGYGEGT